MSLGDLEAQTKVLQSENARLQFALDGELEEVGGLKQDLKSMDSEVASLKVLG